jgi:hypothetical protein
MAVLLAEQQLQLVLHQLFLIQALPVQYKVELLTQAQVVLQQVERVFHQAVIVVLQQQRERKLLVQALVVLSVAVAVQ